MNQRINHELLKSLVLMLVREYWGTPLVFRVHLTNKCSIWVDHQFTRVRAGLVNNELCGEKMNEIEKFQKELRELIDLLEEFGVENWRSYFEKALNTSKTDIRLSAKQVLGAYGGIGSFNDCTLPYHKSKTEKGFSLSEKRIKFNNLHESIYALAKKIEEAI